MITNFFSFQHNFTMGFWNYIYAIINYSSLNIILLLMLLTVPSHKSTVLISITQVSIQFLYSFCFFYVFYLNLFINHALKTWNTQLFEYHSMKATISHCMNEGYSNFALQFVYNLKTYIDSNIFIIISLIIIQIPSSLKV